MVNKFKILVALLFSSVLLVAGQSPCFHVTQTLRQSWVQDSQTYYLYDLSITNNGASTATPPPFGVASSQSLKLVSSWNLMQTLSYDDKHLSFTLYDYGASHPVEIAPGATYTGAGYIVNATTEVNNGGDYCRQSSRSASASSDSTCFHISQTLRQTWVQDSQTYYLYDLAITNNGASTSTPPLFGVASSQSIKLVSSWNLMQTLSYDNNHLSFTVYDYGASHPVQVAPGETYTGAGYIANATTEVNYGGDYCRQSSRSASASSDAPCFHVTQTLRSTWQQDSQTNYLYDLAITNNGASTATPPPFGVASSQSIKLVSSWNMMQTLSYDDKHLSFTLYNYEESHPIEIAPGETYRGAGYVVNATTEVNYGGDYCSTPSSTSTSSDSSCDSIAITQTLANSWDSGSQWTVTLANTGSSPVTSVDVLAAAPSNIVQLWSMTDAGQGHYTLPSWVSSIAPGGSVQFGYVASTTAKVDFSLSHASC